MTSLPAPEKSSSDSPAAPAATSKTFPAYTHVSPRPPAAGNRAEAERVLAQALQAQRAGRNAEAAPVFERAAQLDPSYFEAHYNLGLALYELRNYRKALATWETALAIRPDSTDVRYNFALTLKAAGYAPDAAAELEKILAIAPNESRAHLVLGNLYAESLHNTAKARLHYQRVLDLDPRHPQATAIRYWLVAHPT